MQTVIKAFSCINRAYCKSLKRLDRAIKHWLEEM
jgi:hypothetical protein